MNRMEDDFPRVPYAGEEHVDTLHAHTYSAPEEQVKRYQLLSSHAEEAICSYCVTSGNWGSRV